LVPSWGAEQNQASPENEISANKSFLQKIGHINKLAREHGSVADAIKLEMSGDKSSELTAIITEQMDRFHVNLDQVAKKTGTLSHIVITLMTKLWKSGKQ
jgi:hypothetical protein